MQHQKNKGTHEQHAGRNQGGDHVPQQSSNTTRDHGITGPKGGKKGGHDVTNTDPRPGKTPAYVDEPAKPGEGPKR